MFLRNYLRQRGVQRWVAEGDVTKEFSELVEVKAIGEVPEGVGREWGIREGDF